MENKTDKNQNTSVNPAKERRPLQPYTPPKPRVRGETDEMELKEIALDDIITKRNIRKSFDDESLNELAESIKANGLLNPISVYYLHGEKKYCVETGERRYRASKLAGKTSIPCLIVKCESKRIELERQLIENLQREDLNALETAKSITRLISLSAGDIVAVGKQLGMSRTRVVMRAKLAQLPGAIHKFFGEKSAEGFILTQKHAETLFDLTDDLKKIELATEAYEKKLSATQLAKLIDRLLNPTEPKETPTISEVTESDKERIEKAIVSAGIKGKVVVKEKANGKKTFSFEADDEGSWELLLSKMGAAPVHKDNDEDNEDNEGIPAISLTAAECEQLKKACGEVLQNEAGITDFHSFKVSENGSVAFIVGYNSLEQAKRLNQEYASGENPNFRIFGGFHATNVEEFREKLGLASLQEDTGEETQDEGEPVTQTPKDAGETPANDMLLPSRDEAMLAEMGIIKVTSGRKSVGLRESALLIEALKRGEAEQEIKQKGKLAICKWEGKVYKVHYGGIPAEPAETQAETHREQDIDAVFAGLDGSQINED